jgi:hypothetical protein
MSIIGTNAASGAANAAVGLQAFWQKVASALDRLVINRSRRAVPAIALRQSGHDFGRCRRLMRRGASLSGH